MLQGYSSGQKEKHAWRAQLLLGSKNVEVTTNVGEQK